MSPRNSISVESQERRSSDGSQSGLAMNCNCFKVHHQQLDVHLQDIPASVGRGESFD